jgi:hypothetical protein
MDNKISFDRSLFIPIFIGFFSVLGICLVMIASRLQVTRGQGLTTDTTTPMQYQYLATEPGVVFPTEAPSPTEPPATSIPTFDLILPTSTFFGFKSPVPTTSRATSVGQPFSTNTPTPSISPTAQFLNVTYDDADFKFLYTGNWIAQSGVSNVYQNTLHISNTIGESVQLSFVGQKIRFTYQAGPSLGTVAIKLDGVDFSQDQAAADTLIGGWESPVLVLSSHSITITHISGGSINIDAIAVLDISTPTPTSTATP